MENTGEQKPGAKPQHLLTDPLEEHVELLEGALFVAISFAEQAGADIGFNVEGLFRERVLKALTPEAAELLGRGEEAFTESGQSVRFLSDDDLSAFVGLIFFVDATSARLELLKSVERAMAVVVPKTAAELADVAAAFPSIGRAILRAEPTLPPLTDSQKERLAWLDDRYDRLSAEFFNPNSDVKTLGSNEPQVCRYCGKSGPETTFANLSHAFPELIGNKKLVDLRECDVCNEHFSRLLEDQFGKWSLPSRTAGRILGKKKVPSYKSADQKFRIDVTGNELKIKHPQGDPRVIFHHDSQRIEMQLERQPYTPMGVFKCLVKMALAVMPERELHECQHLKNWILEPTHTFESFQYKPLMLFGQLVPGPIPNDRVTYILLRRKASVTGCPYMMFVVMYGNHVHQIVLPMPAQDTVDGRSTLSIRYFPTPFDGDDYVSKFGRSRLTQEDLSSPEVRRDDVSPIHFSFEKATTVPPAQTT